MTSSPQDSLKAGDEVRYPHEVRVFEGMRFCPACSTVARFMVEPEACMAGTPSLRREILRASLGRRADAILRPDPEEN